MSKFVGYLMLFVAAFCGYMSYVRINVISSLAEVGITRPGAPFEILLLVLCGVVLPLGFAAILLRKPPKD